MAEPQLCSTAVMPMRAAQMLGIDRDCERGLGCRLEQEIVDHRLDLVGNIAIVTGKVNTRKPLLNWLVASAP